MKDLYKTLGVGEDAEEAAIKKAYRKLAKEFHPDITGDDKRKTERFKEINEAYDVLGDSKKRKEYDRLKHAPVRPDGMPEGFDADAFAQTFGRSRAGAGGSSGGGGMSGEFDMNDLFATLFGGGGAGGAGFDPRRPRARSSRGSDVAGRVEVTFVESALGGKRTIRTGSGGSVEVNIPPGVENGGRLRLPGQGAPAPTRNGTPGDLYLDIEVRPDAHLQRHGSDIELDLPVTFAEAALGAKIEVPTVEGRVTVTVPAGTSSGARLRLRGRGVKNGDGSRGDQLCRVEIVAPKIKPDDTETRKLLEELARRTATSGEIRRF
ncbi:MAG TPA: J domain-containing protein [Polyangia bacterium]|jgi:DnaJ-class molecular chaperone|nr:J domain-containing protein [Polyangia bacterium]